jgi:flagellar basal body L-ring protein FlgH
MSLCRLAMIAALLSSACAQLKGNMRDDVAGPNAGDRETSYGRFPEGNWVDDPGPPGRGLASGNGVGYAPRRTTWVTQDSFDAAQRDRQRSPASEIQRVQQAQGMPGAPAFKNGNRATKDDFIDDAPSEGSLWASTGQTNYFFVKNKVKSGGDIVTLTMDENLLKNAALELRKVLTKEELDLELKEAKKKKIDELAKLKPAAPPKDAGREVESEKPSVEVTLADVDPRPRMQIAAGDQMMGEIVERYSNGNYKIRATKRIPYQGGYKMVYLIGIARSADISEEDTIEAGKLYEYRLKVAQQ